MWRRANSLSLLVALFVSFASPSPSIAEVPIDVSAPEVKRVSINLKSLGNNQSKTVLLRATLGDDRSVQSATCQLRLGLNVTQEGNFRRVSGTRKSGTWECRITMQKGTEIGSWMSVLRVFDSVGNQSTYTALTDSQFELETNTSNSVPTIRHLSGGIVTVEDTVQRGLRQNFPQPFSLVGEFGVGGYAEVWPAQIEGRSLAVEWFADDELLLHEEGIRLSLTDEFEGKTLVAKVSVTGPGFRDKVIHVKARHPIGDSVSDSNSNAGWTYPDGVRSLSRPMCFTPQPISSLGTARVGWAIETYCPYTNSSSFGYPTAKRFVWFSDSTPRAITTRGTYKIESSDANRNLYMVYEQVWANGFWVAGVEQLESSILPTIQSQRPQIKGRIAAGKTLTAVPGAWTRGTKFTYQWFRDFAPIPGATARTLRLTDLDVGEPLNVLIRGTLDGYNPSSKVSTTVPRRPVLRPDVQTIYDNAISSYTPGQSQQLTEIYASPTVDPVSLEVNESLLQKAADFWAPHFDGTSVRVIFVSTADESETWLDEFFTEHPTWGAAATIRQKINAHGCGWAYANAETVIQCVPSANLFDDNYRQVVPHEYTHLVQFGWDAQNQSRTTPWLVEGMANFYGLALGIASQTNGAHQINKSLADHATQWDIFNGYPWGTFNVLSIIGGQDAEDSRLLFRRGSDLWTNYLLGSLFSEWATRTIGHDNYANFVRDLLRARNGSEEIGETDSICLAYFGMTLDELSYAVAPYFEQRSVQLKDDWR